ncbi:MAG: response regulator [Vampirovibrionales bacterium]
MQRLFMALGERLFWLAPRTLYWIFLCLAGVLTLATLGLAQHHRYLTRHHPIMATLAEQQNIHFETSFSIAKELAQASRPSAVQQAVLQQQLRSHLSKLLANHQQLKHLMQISPLQAKYQARLKTLLEESNPAHPTVGSVLSSFTQNNGAIPSYQAHTARILLNECEQLLESEVADNIQYLYSLQIYLLCALLGIFIVQALWVIRPLLQSMAREQKQLRAAQQRSEKASQAKSDFLANMSHEIRTPVNGTLGMTQLLLDSPLNLEQQEHVQIIQKSTQALLSLLNDILDYSKIEAGMLTVESISFNLLDWTDELIDLVYHDAQKRPFELVVRIDPCVPEHLVGDPARLRQIIWNYLTNAFKFTTHGSVCLDISLEHEILANQSNIPWIRFCVVDTGKGIDPNNIGKLFSKFTQEDNSTSRRFGGTGLGLAISHQLAQLMGGRVGVESKPGEGSCFWYSMPLKTTATTPSLFTALPGLKLLIVEDNPRVKAAMSEWLLHWGIDFSCASDVTEAINALKEAEGANIPYNAVICDYSLSDLPGDILPSLLQQYPTICKPLFIFTAHQTYPDSMETLENLGFCGFLAKPFTPRLLYHMLKRLWLANEQGKKCIPFITRANLEEELRSAQEGNQADDSYSPPPNDHRATAHTKLISPPKIPKIHQGHPYCVLVVEDNPVNQVVAKRFLEKLGLVAEIADTGETALQWTLLKKYDAILMDYSLPGLNGIEISQRIRLQESLNKNSQTPIIAITAHAGNSFEVEALNAGINHVLLKPLHLPHLSQVLNQLLKEREKTA